MEHWGLIALAVAAVIGVGLLVFDGLRENSRFKREGVLGFQPPKTSPPAEPVAPRQQRRGCAGPAFLVLAIAGGMIWWFWPRVEFTDAAIATTKKTIRERYEKNNSVDVLDVVLIRETPRRLVGFVKVRNKATREEVSAECSATMGDNGDSFWQCK